MNTLLRRRIMMGTEEKPIFYDRLVFDGTAYIDTDIIPPADCSFRTLIGNETLKAAQRIFRADGKFGVIMNASTNSTRRSFVVYYGQTGAFGDYQVNSWDETFIFLTPYMFGLNDSLKWTFTKGTDNPAGPLTIGHREDHSGQAYTGSLGSFRIYGSDAKNATNPSELATYTPVYYLRPCTYNGEAGLWCVENNTFYGNTAGAGTLSVRNNT